MIPKIVHYVWFGRKPFPRKVQRCIDSWHRYLPDYEFCLWNEENFDVNTTPFTKQAYEAGKWAYVSDYVRLYVMKNIGGWYFDTDVEILKPLAPFENERLVMGTDENGAVTAIYATEKNHPYWNDVLKCYENLSLYNSDGSLGYIVINSQLQKVLSLYGYVQENKFQELREGIKIFPDDYFHVASLETGKMHFTENSYAVHWQTMLWTTRASRLSRLFRKHILYPMFGDKYIKYWQKAREFVRIKH